MRIIIRAYVTIRICIPLLVALVAPTFAGTEDLSDQLPPGKTLADLGLGERPFGPADRAVRLVEWASFPADYFCQQMGAHGDKLYFGIKRGEILEYALDGTPSILPFLDVATLRGAAFRDITSNSFSYGLRGFAIHPGYGTDNQLVYTLHTETNTGSADHYITANADFEYVLGEWDLSGGTPSMREVFRIGYPAPSIAHRAQNIGFNPQASPGDADYGNLYACFGDGTSGNAIIDFYGNSQDFSNITAAVIRIFPNDPSAQTDGELAGLGLKRSDNGKYSIPLDNPWVGTSGYAEELYAKGLRNPVSMNFAPDGSPMVGDVGEQAMEEINLIENGGNYGWCLREGTFAFTRSDQTTHDVLEASASLTWVPYGAANDPAYTILFRDKDGLNSSSDTVTRSGADDDGLVYPVAQFTHEGNRTSDGRSAVAAGQYYNGSWAEELEGLYVFGNFTKDTLFYIETKDIVNDDRPADVMRLPLIDENGDSISLQTIIGAERSNMRFGRDRYGNLYLVSKTNYKVYRFQGTPEIALSISSMELPADGKDYPLLSMTHPGPDSTLVYGLESSSDLSFTNVGTGFLEINAVINADATVERSYRYLTPFEDEAQQFFRPTVTGPLMLSVVDGSFENPPGTGN